MRIVIDKDVSEIQQLNESWKKDRPTYKVRAVNSEDKFIYAKGLKTINEANMAARELERDPLFSDCHAEIVAMESSGEGKVVWDSLRRRRLVSETDENSDGKKGGGNDDLLKKTFEGIRDKIAELGDDKLKALKDAGYLTDDNQITGTGYNALKDGKIEDENLKKDLQGICDLLTKGAKEVVDKSGKYKPLEEGKIQGTVTKGEKDPIVLTIEVQDKDSDKTSSMMLSQDGQAKTEGGEGEGENKEGAGETKKMSKEEMLKDPKAGIENLTERVEKLEQGKVSESSKWNFNNEVRTNKVGFERMAIKRFFNEMNDSSVKYIKFVRADGTFKMYDTSRASESYAAFKKDFRESTDRMAGQECDEFKVVVEGRNSTLNGYKFSDFGISDDFDSTGRTVYIKESIVRSEPPKPTKKAEESSEKTEDIKKKSSENLVSESLDLELDVVDPLQQVKSILSSMNKYNGVDTTTKIDDLQDGSIADGVSTYPDVKNDDLVQEAEGDEEGGGDDAGGAGDDAGGADADPFAGGGDEGGEAEADPFAGGGDEGGGDAGGDPFAGGDEGGGEADPFAGGDDAGGAEGGGEGGDVAAAGDAGAEAGAADAGQGEAEGEPAPEEAVNTDAQGNPMSQYNINVTRPFNVDDNFSLNEEEQKEFFGKIDQLVKIPDMDNFSLYLYQITPDNLNLDDVHYIEALYQLSVKLGLLEDTYADSNLLEKYNSYKYSVVKNGEEEEGGSEEGLNENTNPIWKEAKEKKLTFPPKVQQNNEENAKALNDQMKKKNDDRRGPKEDLSILNLDKNGVSKPRIIDTTEDGWTNKMKTNGEDKGSDFEGTELAQSRGMGWLATFKAMQFGSPRYLTMYIKQNGTKDKKEKQCEDYLKRLSYTDIEFVNIEDVDPYEYVYRSHAGMKTPETVRTEKYANEAVPVTYFENTQESIPNDIKRDVKRVITKLNAEIRNTKQFNFLTECGVEKPQIVAEEFLNAYKTAKVDETLSETTYKFVLKQNDSTLSRMFHSNLKEKLFRYLGTFATKYNMECECEATPSTITISFTRSEMGNPTYDLDTMIDAEEEQKPVDTAPTLDQALEIAKKM